MRGNTAAVILAGVLPLTVLFCSCADHQSQSSPRQSVSVKAWVVQRSDEVMTGTYTGSLEGKRQASLRARISEPVDTIMVQEGDSVARGQVILRLNRAGTSSEYERLKSLYENAEKNFQKMKHLYEQGAISETTFDAAKTEYEVDRASFEAVSRSVFVESPIDGVLSSLDVSQGEYVQIGQLLATVATADSLRIKFHVSPEEVGAMLVGDSVAILVASTGATATGVIESIASAASPETRTFEIEALMANESGHFHPGMFVLVNHLQKKLSRVVAVPQQAIVSLDGESVVFIVSNGKAVRRVIRRGTELSGKVVIEAGLETGDTLVILGQNYLNDGSPVTIAELVEGRP